ncbi:hypothetical protein [Rhizobium phage RHph_N46]|nr:hypothetical protein [Rhizobium phage RHph_N46]
MMRELEENKGRTYDWLHPNMPISYAHYTDKQMANAVRMLMRHDLMHEGIVVGARDRIMCLVKEKAALIEENQNLREELAALKANAGMQEETNHADPEAAADATIDKGLHSSHDVRVSDASTFDVICKKCGAHDEVPGGWGKLADPCPKAETV